MKSLKISSKSQRSISLSHFLYFKEDKVEGKSLQEDDTEMNTACTSLKESKIRKKTEDEITDNEEKCTNLQIINEMANN